MNNKIILLNKKPQNYNMYIIIISFLLFISSLWKIYTYDSYYLTGIITCNEECSIKASIPYNKIDIFNNSKIEYQNKEYEIKEITYEEPYLNNSIPYEDITIKTDINSKDRLINFKIIYNKQRIINKIKNIMKGV